MLEVLHLRETNTMALGIILILMGMGVAVLVIFIERLAALARSRHESAAFAREAAPLMAERDWPRLRERAQAFSGSHQATMLTSALDLLSRGDGPVKPSWLQPLRREILRRHSDARTDLRRGLDLLWVVASAAPMVGLVAALTGAFDRGLSAAFGVGIATLAVVAFGVLSVGADRLTRDLAMSARQLMDHLTAHAGAPVPGQPVAGRRKQPEGPQGSWHADLPAA
jgi:biopolymer transport protein ExbB/TolQ